MRYEGLGSLTGIWKENGVARIEAASSPRAPMESSLLLSPVVCFPAPSYLSLWATSQVALASEVHAADYPTAVQGNYAGRRRV